MAENTKVYECSVYKIDSKRTVGKDKTSSKITVVKDNFDYHDFEKKLKDIKSQEIQEDNILLKVLLDFYRNNLESFNSEDKENFSPYEMRVVGRIIQKLPKKQYYSDQEVKVSNEDKAVDFIISSEKISLNKTLQQILNDLTKDARCYICEVKLSTSTHKKDIWKDFEKLKRTKEDNVNEENKQNVHCCFIYIDLKEPVIYVCELA